MAIYSFSTDGGDSFDFSFGGDLERSSRPRHAHFRHGDSAYHDRVELRGRRRDSGQQSRRHGIDC